MGDLVAVVLVVVAFVGAIVVFRADLQHDDRSGPRRIVEAAIPFLALVGLLWWFIVSR